MFSKCSARRVVLILTWLAMVPLRGMAEPWHRHTIDDSSRGADGVRTSDVNRDGWQDLVTGWEEGGVIRVYLNPGPALVHAAWPAITVGRVKSPEDAVFADLDADGRMDVISCCEGKNRTVFIHWAPREIQSYRDPDSWTTTAIPCTAGRQLWMFALPMQIDRRNGIDVVVGSKGPGASISWLESPADPRDVDGWRLHRIAAAGWIMSLRNHDMNNDGRLDVLVSDRKGPTRGIKWLEHPRADHRTAWPVHPLGGEDREVMFLDLLAGQGSPPSIIHAAVRGRGVLSLDTADGRAEEVPWPLNCGTGKAVAAADVDLNGSTDLVISCENAAGNKSGVRWLSRAGKTWIDHEISGPQGVKFDRLELLDLDQDGDLDVITCEERADLGVIWFENPVR